MDHWRAPRAECLGDCPRRSRDRLLGKRLELGICGHQHVQILTLTLFAGSGNSGDVIRARRDTALIALNASATADLDKTSFWRVALFRYFKNNGAGNDQGTDEAQHVIQDRSDDVHCVGMDSRIWSQMDHDLSMDLVLLWTIKVWTPDLGSHHQAMNAFFLIS
ncbi:hypothetical protein E8E14_004624 [Neopestalotiopsis sp. 37M]|nr:hypothetical protein E8E14_004624 [Neopestalotiopsis sp. 37M]